MTGQDHTTISPKFRGYLLPVYLKEAFNGAAWLIQA
jgi:hypothetical protein